MALHIVARAKCNSTNTLGNIRRTNEATYVEHTRQHVVLLAGLNAIPLVHEATYVENCLRHCLLRADSNCTQHVEYRLYIGFPHVISVGLVLRKIFTVFFLPFHHLYCQCRKTPLYCIHGRDMIPAIGVVFLSLLFHCVLSFLYPMMA